MSRSPRRLLTIAAVVVCLTSLAACSDAGESASDQSASEDAGSSETSGQGECSYPSAGQPAAEAEPPPADPAVEGQVPVTFETSAGAIDAVLDADSAPCTVNSLVSLAGQGYFEDTPCHRLTAADTLSVLQCGDPSGTGGGGPGYSFPDELTGGETYPAGTLAMANAGPDTNGSQFFLVYEDSQLDPAYTVFGTIGADGLATLREATADGVDGAGPDGAPATPVEVSNVAVG